MRMRMVRYYEFIKSVLITKGEVSHPWLHNGSYFMNLSCDPIILRIFPSRYALGTPFYLPTVFICNLVAVLTLNYFFLR